MITRSLSEEVSHSKLLNSYPLSHLGTRSATEVEMKMQMAKRMALQGVRGW